MWTSAHVHICTIVQLHICTCSQLHICTCEHLHMFMSAQLHIYLHEVARSVLPATSGATTPVQISQAIKESHEKKTHNISKQKCNQRVCSMYHDFLHFQSPDELIVYCEIKSRMLGSTGRPQHQKSTFFRNFQDMKELKKSLLSWRRPHWAAGVRSKCCGEAKRRRLYLRSGKWRDPQATSPHRTTSTRPPAIRPFNYWVGGWCGGWYVSRSILYFLLFFLQTRLLLCFASFTT